jgi:hypothetical protein
LRHAMGAKDGTYPGSAAAFPGGCRIAIHHERTAAEEDRNVSTLVPHPLPKEPLMHCRQHLQRGARRPTSSPTLALSSVDSHFAIARRAAYPMIATMAVPPVSIDRGCECGRGDPRHAFSCLCFRRVSSRRTKRELQPGQRRTLAARSFAFVRTHRLRSLARAVL